MEKGFKITSIDTSLSRIYNDRIPISENITIDGVRHRHAVVVIKMESNGDVEYITETDITNLINKKIGHNISFMGETNKPPIGLKPKWLHVQQRQMEIMDAMMRYLKANKEIPQEWMKELYSYTKE